MGPKTNGNAIASKENKEKVLPERKSASRSVDPALDRIMVETMVSSRSYNVCLLNLFAYFLVLIRLD